MGDKDRCQQRTGLNWYQFRQLRGQVTFLQDFKCWGCKEPIIPENGLRILHHLDGNPKNNELWNLAVVCQVCHFDLHGWQNSVDRGLKPKKKRISKKESIRQRIMLLGGF